MLFIFLCDGDAVRRARRAALVRLVYAHGCVVALRPA